MPNYILLVLYWYWVCSDKEGSLYYEVLNGGAHMNRLPMLRVPRVFYFKMNDVYFHYCDYASTFLTTSNFYLLEVTIISV